MPHFETEGELIMKLLFALLFALTLLAGNTVQAVAQDRPQAQVYGDEQRTPPLAARDYEALVQDVFAPITEELHLTKEQEFQIIAIITGTEVRVDSLVQQLDEVDQRLADASLIDSPDEATINRLSAAEALLLTQMIAMKARAKGSIYQLLTPEQRTLFSHQFRGKSQLEGNLGAIVSY
jgi:Spy/CpxP family protein refolding chaperone